MHVLLLEKMLVLTDWMKLWTLLRPHQNQTKDIYSLHYLGTKKEARSLWCSELGYAYTQTLALETACVMPAGTCNVNKSISKRAATVCTYIYSMFSLEQPQ